MPSICQLTWILCTIVPRVISSQQQPISSPHTDSWSPIQQVLRYSSVIPDVLDDFEPSVAVSIAYPQTHATVELGNVLFPDQASSRPVFEFHPISEGRVASNKTFTLVLTDPDAKSREKPKWSEFCHWIVTNLTASAGAEGISDGVLAHADGELVKYYPPAPPAGTGQHRYVFVLLEGDGTRALTEPKERKHWGYKKARHGVRDWADENNLTVVGANFFYASQL